MNIKKLLELESKLNGYNMYYRRFERYQKLELGISTIVSLLLITFSIVGFYAILVGLPTSKHLLDGLFSIYFLTAFSCIGLALIFRTIKRWYKYKKPIQEKIYRIYNNINSSSIIETRFADEGIKTQIVFLFLKRNKLLYNHKIEQIINSLKFESELPIYQYRFIKLFNSLFLLLVGAFVAEIFKPAYSGQKNQPKVGFEQVIETFKIVLGIAIMLWALVWFIEKIIVRPLFESFINKHYKVNLIRSLQEIKLRVDN